MTRVILMYHRIADIDSDPYGLAIHPECFARQVEHLLTLSCVVPLTEITSSGRGRRIALTFDDGYADNALTAAPLLAAVALPATYFITTGRLGAQRFWWDRLAAAFLGGHVLPPGIDVSIGGADLWLALNDAPARRTALSFLHRRLRPLPPLEVETVTSDLLQRLAAPPPPDSAVTMTADQVRTLADLPLVEVGAHTRTHLQLAGQSENLQRAEVHGSVADVSALLDRPVTSFAYPFGTRRAVGDLAPRLVRDAGCLLACSTEPGGLNRRSDHYRLPRLNVRQWEPAELAVKIEQAATFR